MLDSLGNPSMFHNTQTLTIPLPQIPHIDVTKIHIFVTFGENGYFLSFKIWCSHYVNYVLLEYRENY